MAEKVLRDRGYRSDTIAISRDMGPRRSWPYTIQPKIMTLLIIFRGASGQASRKTILFKVITRDQKNHDSHGRDRI